MSAREVLVVGAGPAGLAAAIAAARLGASVTLADEGARPGGQLRYRRRLIELDTGESVAPAELAGRLVGEAREAGVRMLPGTSVWGAFGDGGFGASRGDEPMLFTPDATVLATGSTDLPLIFPGGSLAGVFTGRALLIMANDWGVLPARRWVTVGLSRLPEVETSIAAAGGEVVARAGADARLRAFGGPLLEMVEIDGRPFEADGLVVCAGRQPDAALAMMAEVPFGFDAALGGYAPVLDAYGRTARAGLLVCGDAAGTCSPELALAEGAVAGAAAAGAGAAGTVAADRDSARLVERLSARRASQAGLRARYAQPVR
ncbi:MAG: FAD-dependent oxidoreductase [Chloroflexota bacterium]